jgi:hypothetical protein
MNNLPIMKRKGMDATNRSRTERTPYKLAILPGGGDQYYRIGFSSAGIWRRSIACSYKMDVFDFSWLYYARFALVLFVFLLPLRILWPPGARTTSCNAADGSKRSDKENPDALWWRAAEAIDLQSYTYELPDDRIARYPLEHPGPLPS